MILSNSEVLSAIDEGRLVIDPQPHPRGHVEGQKCPYQTSAVDLRLGPELSIFKEKPSPVAIDLSDGGFAVFAGSATEQKTITDDQPFRLKPGLFILGRTLEKVGLPIQKEADRTLAARVEGKSSYARCGLLVHFTAPTIHAGFAGTIALEIINLGHYPILLRPKMLICQLIVEEVRGVPFRNEGQFQNQARPTGHSS